jgi:hypothetical protein
MSIIESRILYTPEQGRAKGPDFGERAARAIKRSAERNGLTLGEGTVRWDDLGDEGWLLEVMIPIIDGELDSGLHLIPADLR